MARSIPNSTQTRSSWPHLQTGGLPYDSVADDPISLPDSFGATIDVDNKENIDSEFSYIVSNAELNGLSTEGQLALSAVLKKYRDVFRVKLGGDNPPAVPPLVIKTKLNPRPHRAPKRWYAPPNMHSFSVQFRNWKTSVQSTRTPLLNGLVPPSP